MDELIAAIIDAWAAASTLTDVPNPFDSLSEDAATYPRATYAVFSAADEYHFDDTVISEPVVSFTIFHTDRAETGSYLRALEDTFSKVKLTLSDSVEHMSTRLVRRDFGSQFRPHADGDTVYRGTIDFRFQIHRDLP